jgi:HSP20 family protein
MNLEKINPWNWFKHEDSIRNQSHQIPVSRKDAGVLATSSQPNSLLQLHQQMDQFFNDALSAFGMPSLSASLTSQRLLGNEFFSAFRPLIDVSGDEKQYEITLDVPGLLEQDISIEVSGDVLTIKGQKEEVNENKDKQFYRVERSIGSFQRTLSLPGDASSDDIRARLSDGVLTLDIPRHPSEQKDIKHISISS